MFLEGKIRAILVGFGMLGAGAAIPAAVAADEFSPDRTPLIQAQDEADSFEEDTIEAFAAAQVRIEEIRSSYMPEFQAAQTEEERQEINQVAAQEMVEAVENMPDLSLEEFNEIAQAAAEDPALAERIDEAIADSQT